MTLIAVLRAIYLTPKTLQSDFARLHAGAVGRLASTGCISTAELDGTYGFLWRCTWKGLRVLEQIGDDDDDAAP